VRAPFLAAAAMNALNFLLTLWLVRESHTTRNADTPAERISLNPLASLRWAASFKSILPMIIASGVLVLVGEIGGTVWVLYGEDKFTWDALTIGISLACFGAFHALAQAFIVGPIAERWGERRALIVGMSADTCAYIMIALATHGWMAFALMPLFCLGGIGAPALQSLLSSSVGPEQQGKLQGVLAAMASLANVIGPVAISTIYFMSRGSLPGLVWLIGAGLYLLCLPVLISKPTTAIAPSR
jgi:DHA1 family tetracycline resistance protein-like MFS transporter